MMKFLGATSSGVALDLAAADCLALADAVAFAQRRDAPGNWEHLAALGAALHACAIVASLDTIQADGIKPAEVVAHVRRVWGANGE